MKRLNREAGDLAREYNLRSGTDITGFGLLGHALEMAQASKVGMRLYLEQIPMISCARRYANDFVFPGGSSDNRLYFGTHVRFDDRIDEPSQMLLFDAQTSGGLLLSVPSGQVDSLQQRAEQIGQPLWVIGEVLPGAGIDVVP